MRYNYVGFLISLLPLALSNPYPFPENKKLLYSYHATVTMGSRELGFYATKYEIFADLHVKNKERTWAQLTGVTYSFHDGPSMTGTSKKIRVPPEAEAIKYPFGLLWKSEFGKSTSVQYLDERDENWSKTMKKFLGHLLKVDKKTILDENFAKDPKTFSEAIDVKYKDNKDEYTCVSGEAGHIAFIRRLPAYYEEKWYVHTAFIPKFDDCGEHESSVYYNDVRRYYDIIKEGNELKLNKVYSNNTIRFAFNMDEYFAKIDQEIRLVSTRNLTGDIPDFGKFNVMRLFYLNYYMKKDSSDLSGGRRRQNMTSIKSSVENIFLSVCDRANNIEISKSNIDLDGNDNLIVLIDEMKLLDSESLYALYLELLKNDQILDKKQIDIYVLALAFTGNIESLKTIQKLISEKIIDDDLAVRTLREVPFNIKAPDYLYFDDMKNLLEKESNYSPAVREAIILSSTALLKRSPEMVIVNGLDANIFFQFFEHITEKLQNATEHDEQLLYLTALLNMKLDTVGRYVVHLVKKNITNVEFTPHIRSLAMIGFVSFLEYVENSLANRQKSVSQFLQPVFSDTNEDYEVRATALHILLHYGTKSDLEILLEHMKTENDEQFLSMFHTAVQSFIKSTSECYRNRVEGIKNMYSEMPKPKINRRTSSLVKLLDYYDKVNKFGSMLKISTYGDEKVNGFNTAFIEYTWKFKKMFFDQYMIYVHIKNDPSLPGYTLGILEILRLTEKDMPIEIIVYRNTMAVKIVNTSPKGLLKYLSEFQGTFEFPLTYNLDQTYSSEFVIGSDMGVPVVFYQKKPSLTMMKAKSVNEEAFSSTNVQFSRWSRGEYGLKVYNPIANMWHGVQRVQSDEVNIYAEIENHRSGKLVWKVTDAKSLPLGVRSEVQTEVYISGEVSMKTIVQSPQISRENHTFLSFDDEDTGLTFNFGIVDCVAQQKEKHVNQIRQKFLISDSKNPGDNVWMNLYLVAQKIWDYFSVFPGTGKCGLALNIGKSENFNATHYEARIDPINTKKKPKDIVRPKRKIALYKMRRDETLNKFEIVFTNNLRKKTKFSGVLEVENLKKNRSNPYMVSSIDLNSSSDDIRSDISILFGEKNDQEISMKSAFNLSITGKLSEDQNDQNREIELYHECLSKSLGDSYDCIKKLTSLRSYDFDISYKEPVAIFDTIKEYFYGLIKSVYPDAFERIDISKKIDEGKIKMSLTYPLVSEGVADFSLTTSSGKIEVENLALENCTIGKLLEPYSAFAFRIFPTKSYCKFSANNMWNDRNQDEKDFVLPTKWTRMTGNCHNYTCFWEVMAKRIDDVGNTLALRIVSRKEIVDIYIDKKIEIFLNNKLMDISGDSRYFHTKFTNMKVFKDDLNVIVHIESVPLIINFDGIYSKIYYRTSNMRVGMCHS